jgi:hypothetical protein
MIASLSRAHFIETDGKVSTSRAHPDAPTTTMARMPTSLSRAGF